MFRKINIEYSSLPNSIQLLLLLLIYWVIWFFVELTSQWFSGENYPTPQLRDFTSSFVMGIIWTLLGHFNKVKHLFKKKNVNAG